MNIIKDSTQSRQRGALIARPRSCQQLIVRVSFSLSSGQEFWSSQGGEDYSALSHRLSTPLRVFL